MPAHPILTSLNNIIGKNVQIQKGDFSQQVKDVMMKITNESLKFTIEELSAQTINKLVMNEYRKSKSNNLKS